MSTDPNLDRRIATVAVGAAIIFLAAAILFWATGAGSGSDDPDPDPAPASEPTAQAAAPGASRPADASPKSPLDDAGDRMVEAARKLPLPEDCHVHVNQAVMASDPATGEAFAAIGIATDSIRPAQPAGIGAHALMVRNTTRVDCDLSQGVIGTRGGIRFSVGDRRVELRRARIDLTSGSMAVFPESTGSASFIGSRIDPATIERIHQPGEMTAVIPMMFTAELSRHFNEQLGITLTETGDVIGSLTITASTHPRPLETPDAHS